MYLYDRSNNSNKNPIDDRDKFNSNRFKQNKRNRRKINEDRDKIDRVHNSELSISHTIKMLANNSSKKADKNESVIKAEELKSAMDDMNRLVGLENIKSLIRQYISFVKIQRLRERYSLKKLPIVMHMIFRGNPGTGKTTVARIIARIFNAIDYLSSGHIIEAERADLVGEYIGHTAQKTKKLIDKAMGGILFIDEAYALARGGEKDFGKEAIDTVVKAMEDYKDDLIIIMAGYRKEMEEFLQTNPGLRSRFALHLDFKDYDIDQLVEIAELMYEEREYILTEPSKYYLYRILSLMRSNNKMQGNARQVRNIVEKSIRHHAHRVVAEKMISRKDLMNIERADLVSVFNDIN